MQDYIPGAKQKKTVPINTEKAANLIEKATEEADKRIAELQKSITVQFHDRIEALETKVATLEKKVVDNGSSKPDIRKDKEKSTSAVRGK